MSMQAGSRRRGSVVVTSRIVITWHGEKWMDSKCPVRLCCWSASGREGCNTDIKIKIKIKSKSNFKMQIFFVRQPLRLVSGGPQRGQALSRLAFGALTTEHGRSARNPTRMDAYTYSGVQVLASTQISRPSEDSMGLQQGRCTARRANRAAITDMYSYLCCTGNQTHQGKSIL